jgi:hypothetical protein
VTFHGEFSPTPVEQDTGKPVLVDSALPNPDGIVPTVDQPHGTERSPGDMTRTSGDGEFTGRKTTEFLRWAYSRDGTPLRTADAEPYRVDGRRVVFS